MKIWISKYKLYPKTDLSQLMHRPNFRLGSMIKVEFDSGEVGYADCCPIEALGDRNIHLQLESLKTASPLPLVKRSLELAEIDAKARSENKCLFKPEVLVKNHYLISHPLEFDFNKIGRLISEGYDCFKLKLGRELRLEAEVLENLCESLSESVTLRIDFNCGFKTLKECDDFFERYWDKLKNKVDLVEDPMIYNEDLWAKIKEKYNVPMAVDFAANPLEVDLAERSISTIVIKPARQNSDQIIKKYMDTNIEYVFTHYMDYPIGQISALVEAQKHALFLKDKLKTCGLQARDIYLASDFSRAIEFVGPYVKAPKGLGIGFDEIIEDIEWTPLIVS